MISYIRIVRVGAYIYADLVNRIPVEGYGTFLHTISGCIVAEGIMAKDSLAGIGAFTDTLLVLIGGPGGIRTDIYAGIVDGLPKKKLHSWALDHTHPCGVICKPRVGTILYT